MKSTALSALSRHFANIRLGEVLVLQGTPLMGVILSVENPSFTMLPPLLVFVPASFFLVLHIWLLNDWSDYLNDRIQETARPWGDVSQNALLNLSIASLILSMACFFLLPWRTGLIALLIAALGMIYSYPGLRIKEKAGLAALSHLLGGSLHFLLGYSLFGETVSHPALLISSFFALVFTAGHATQEVQDYPRDHLAGVRTQAVIFGREPVFLSACAGFAAAFILLTTLAIAGVVPARLGASILLLPLQGIWSCKVLRHGLTTEKIRWLRMRYRLLFGLVGLNIFSLLIWPAIP